MKQPDNTNEDPRLNRLLREWRVDKPLPPRFEESVWQKVEAAESRGARAGSGSWTEWLALLFARPAFATAGATLLLAAGLAVGVWRAEQDASRWDTELAKRYVSSVNPYAGERH